MNIIEKVLERIKLRKFVAVATSDRAGVPNSAPKLLLKIDGKAVYLVDYSIGKTHENLKINPQISISFIDGDSLFGYKLEGKAEIIEKGKVYEECLNELKERELELTIERVIEGVRAGKPHKVFEVEIPERSLVYKVKIEAGSEITPWGEIKRESSGAA
jgi:predicted pyridoxine 5'-phosphate oxidase superfamily flavin-nucleotide-binding protein